MATLSELTVQVLTARLTKKEMSLEELQKEMMIISNMIKSLDEGTLSTHVAEAREEPKPKKILVPVTIPVSYTHLTLPTKRIV